MNDVTLMQIAFLVARESKCVSHQVGAVISKDGRIIATGINGTKSGLVNCCDHSMQQGWLSCQTDDIETPKMVKIGNENYYPPEGSTHCFEALGIHRFVKVVGEDVHHWDNKAKHWYKISTSFTILKELKDIIWENPNIGKRQYFSSSIQKPYKLNPVFRDAHSAWSSENEIHAEKNALLFCNKHGLSVEGATMHVTLSPCFQCAKELPVTGIKRIVYCDLYDRNMPNDWLKKFKDAGVVVDKIDKSQLKDINWS